ncbi:UDP-3-O-acyl-N-acetylglucosamine deacetylase [Candidatus Pelagibacter sp.]|nr:UDP-3-O-acyl-N-acetylglucosamine deacetylase [Candidatus Pelagibacter sp.]
MSLLNQKTIKNNVNFHGVGLHSGKLTNVCLKKSPPDTGIIFKRLDIKKKDNIVYPNFLNVSNTSLNTTISNSQGVKVSTIEHLMGALFGLGIDNVLVEIDNEEVPILDGSSKEFIEKILLAGFEISNKPIKIIKVNKKVELKKGDKFISIEPSKLSLDIDFELKYKNSLIGNQRNKINVYEDDLKEIFESRTFCLYEDIEQIKKNGLAKGGSLENAIVVKNDIILNSEGLRNTLEFVNHKILDCIGDLYTSGYRMLASVKCSQGGHYLTNKLLRELFKNKENFSIIEIQERNLPHTLINRSLLRSIA